MKRLVQIGLAVFLINLISCTNDIRHQFIIENKTQYVINKILIGGTDTLIFSIRPNGTSEPFVVTRRDNMVSLFSEPLLAITVQSYSDSIATYENNIGEVIGFAGFNTDKVNTLTIRNDDSSEYKTKRVTFHKR
jgi:hypothetical protein